jgi:hypothetical protein
MRSFCLFIFAFLAVAAVLLATEWRQMNDYQAYTRPTVEERIK